MSGWRKFKTVFTICAALGWWGIWFPELALWTEAVSVEEQQAVQSEENLLEYETAAQFCNSLLSADREEIQIKSRLLQLVEEYFKKVRTK